MIIVIQLYGDRYLKNIDPIMYSEELEYIYTLDSNYGRWLAYDSIESYLAKRGKVVTNLSLRHKLSQIVLHL